MATRAAAAAATVATTTKTAVVPAKTIVTTPAVGKASSRAVVASEKVPGPARPKETPVVEMSRRVSTVSIPMGSTGFTFAELGKSSAFMPQTDEEALDPQARVSRRANREELLRQQRAVSRAELDARIEALRSDHADRKSVV